MARGKKYSDEMKEKAYFMYATSCNINEVSKELGVPYATIAGWLKAKARDAPDEFDKLRDEKKRDFIDRSSELIDLAFDRLQEKLSGDYDIPVNHLTTVIGTLYDKRALARGESTEKTTIEIKLPEGVDEYAG